MLSGALPSPSHCEAAAPCDSLGAALPPVLSLSLFLSLSRLSAFCKARLKTAHRVSLSLSGAPNARARRHGRDGHHGPYASESEEATASNQFRGRVRARGGAQTAADASGGVPGAVAHVRGERRAGPRGVSQAKRPLVDLLSEPCDAAAGKRVKSDSVWEVWRTGGGGGGREKKVEITLAFLLEDAGQTDAGFIVFLLSLNVECALLSRCLNSTHARTPPPLPLSSPPPSPFLLPFSGNVSPSSETEVSQTDGLLFLFFFFQLQSLNFSRSESPLRATQALSPNGVCRLTGNPPPPSLQILLQCSNQEPLLLISTRLMPQTNLVLEIMARRSGCSWIFGNIQVKVRLL